MSRKLALTLIVGGLIPIAWNGCSKFVAGDFNPGGAASASVSDSVSSPGLEAFRSGFYAFAQTQGCVQCHANTVHPRFASPDVNEAYSEAKGLQVGSSFPLIDFNAPASSIIIVYAGNSHCSSTPCSNPSIRPTVQSLLQSWAFAELGGKDPSLLAPPQPAAYVSASVNLPAKIPTLSSGPPAILRFDLSKLTPAVPTLAKAVFEVQIQMANETEYRITAPKLIGNTGTVSLKGVHVFARAASDSGFGAEDPAQGLAWTGIDTSIPPSNLPNPLPTGALPGSALSTTTLHIQAHSSSDVLTIGFDQL